MKFKDIPEEEVLVGGTSACAGCGALIALKNALKVLGEDTIIVNPAGCMTLLPMWPYSPFKCSFIHNAFENAACTASGIRHVLDIKGEDQNVVVWAGDGSTYDIGFQALSFAATTDENIIYVCYNNQAYSNTGFQWSTATPFGSDSKTQPRGKLNTLGSKPKNKIQQKNMMKIMAAHGVPAASASIGDIPDFITKIEKAIEHKGFFYIEVHIPCTAGWGFEPKYTIKMAKEAVNNGIWPIYEVDKDGILTLNKNPKQLKPVDDYVNSQARYKALPLEGRIVLQDLINRNFEELRKLNGKKYV